ncbi:MAG: TetR/AcrR family transcriptional regulator; helix-turn-helix transcriptional regulator, partial [Coriobacteriales bacterium]|nr:TetR/AcrR family transcriptional regulator; helix-turn-helix transcriptional regulator [Coriobacteriales bacterium]
RDYESASTNAIVRRAGISKGLLFRYFGDKQGLYIYLLAFITQEHYAEATDGIDPACDDIFTIMQKSIETKIDVTPRDLLATRLYMRAMTDDLPPRVREFVSQTTGEAYDTFALMAALLDEGRLREGLDRDMVVRTINWASEGLVNHLLATVGSQIDNAEFRQMMEYTKHYFDFLRRLFYREAEQEPGTGDTGDDTGGDTGGTVSFVSFDTKETVPPVSDPSTNERR